MKKLRTRQHIIEDLGFNHVERQVLLGGCTVQKITRDYGYDGFIHLYNERGEYENGLIQFQLKSTDRLKSANKGYAIDLSKRDLELWLYTTLPMVLFLYDAAESRAYFVSLHDYFLKNSIALRDVRKFVRIYIPASNLFDAEAMRNLRTIVIL